MAPKLDVIIANSGHRDTINIPYRPDEPIFFLLKRIYIKLKIGNKPVNGQDDLFLNGRKLEDRNQTMEYYRIFGHTLTFGFKVEVNAVMQNRVPSDESKDKADLALERRAVCNWEIQSDNTTTVGSAIPWIACGVVTICGVAMLCAVSGVGVASLGGVAKLAGGTSLSGSVSVISKRSLVGGSGLVGTASLSGGAGVVGATIKFSEKAPPGRIGSPGTNVECKCDCTTSHRVICMKSFGTLEIAQAVFVCPNCGLSNSITPVTVGFILCKYRFHGIKASGEQYTSDWKDVTENDCYQLFSADNSIHWRRLIIESANLGHFDDCLICLESLEATTQALDCGHCFHTECIRQWQGPCPSCQYNTHLLHELTTE
ncbi:hypothetical protein BGZ97_010427 [Linnemannia gamsii]|uniref:RING-type domain-containing protein n=1 Tax=Linnemannia gamsii TaxID=64522 RepID=A0A9P6R8D8_9FUNG|nr:hypothetical protein BGZ97_010427 [Linnemannia gamsii]